MNNKTIRKFRKKNKILKTKRAFRKKNNKTLKKIKIYELRDLNGGFIFGKTFIPPNKKNIVYKNSCINSGENCRTNIALPFDTIYGITTNTIGAIQNTGSSIYNGITNLGKNNTNLTEKNMYYHNNTLNGKETPLPRTESVSSGISKNYYNSNSSKKSDSSKNPYLIQGVSETADAVREGKFYTQKGDEERREKLKRERNFAIYGKDTIY